MQAREAKAFEEAQAIKAKQIQDEAVRVKNEKEEKKTKRLAAEKQRLDALEKARFKAETQARESQEAEKKAQEKAEARKLREAQKKKVRANGAAPTQHPAPSAPSVSSPERGQSPCSVRRAPCAPSADVSVRGG